jgi:hypothetical protein
VVQDRVQWQAFVNRILDFQVAQMKGNFSTITTICSKKIVKYSSSYYLFTSWATGWMIGGSSPGRGWEFSLNHRVQNVSGTYAASYPMGTRGCFFEVKRPGHEADHSPSSAVVNDA